MVYVDDVWFVSGTKCIEAPMAARQSNLACKLVGVMARDETESDKTVPSLVFLHITMELQKRGLRLHQREYSENTLKQREIVHGRPSLPVVEEGKSPPVPKGFREEEWYREALTIAQEEVGAVQWWH